MYSFHNVYKLIIYFLSYCSKASVVRRVLFSSLIQSPCPSVFIRC